MISKRCKQEVTCAAHTWIWTASFLTPDHCDVKSVGKRLFLPTVSLSTSVYSRQVLLHGISGNAFKAVQVDELVLQEAAFLHTTTMQFNDTDLNEM